jgi:hypothetical protein
MMVRILRSFQWDDGLDIQSLEPGQVVELPEGADWIEQGYATAELGQVFFATAEPGERAVNARAKVKRLSLSSLGKEL